MRNLRLGHKEQPILSACVDQRGRGLSSQEEDRCGALALSLSDGQ